MELVEEKGLKPKFRGRSDPNWAWVAKVEAQVGGSSHDTTSGAWGGDVVQVQAWAGSTLWACRRCQLNRPTHDANADACICITCSWHIRPQPLTDGRLCFPASLPIALCRRCRALRRWWSRCGRR